MQDELDRKYEALDELNLKLEQAKGKKASEKARITLFAEMVGSYFVKLTCEMVGNFLYCTRPSPSIDIT